MTIVKGYVDEKNGCVDDNSTVLRTVLVMLAKTVLVTLALVCLWNDWNFV